MGIVIGGKSAWKTRETHGWRIAYHWISAGRGQDEEPTMILYPARWGGYNPSGRAPYALQLSQASMLMERTGYSGEKLAEAVLHCCEATGTFPDKPTLHLLRDIILDNLIDLIHMPPREAVTNRDVEHALGRVNVAELKVMVDGQTVMQRDVTALEVGD